MYSCVGLNVCVCMCVRASACIVYIYYTDVAWCVYVVHVPWCISCSGSSHTYKHHVQRKKKHHKRDTAPPPALVHYAGCVECVHVSVLRMILKKLGKVPCRDWFGNAASLLAYTKLNLKLCFIIFFFSNHRRHTGMTGNRSFYCQFALFNSRLFGTNHFFFLSAPENHIAYSLTHVMTHMQILQTFYYSIGVNEFWVNFFFNFSIGQPKCERLKYIVRSIWTKHSRKFCLYTFIDMHENETDRVSCFFLLFFSSEFLIRYQNELPETIKKRGKDAHLVHEELVQVMKWKQNVSFLKPYTSIANVIIKINLFLFSTQRGKIYPQLSYLIKVNTPRAVMQETKKAFRKLPNLEQALTALSNLKGVGTTMASALLAAAAPDNAPFMADECLMAIPDIEGIDYTAKEYLNFVQHIQATVNRLNSETDTNNTSWSAHRYAQYIIFTHSFVLDLSIQFWVWPVASILQN